MSRHLWDPARVMEMRCLRPGCTCMKRFRVVKKAGSLTPAGHRIEFSMDGGETWGDLKTGFSGRVPPCKGAR